MEGFNTSTSQSNSEIQKKYEEVYNDFRKILLKELLKHINLETYSELATTKEGDYMDWQEKYIDKLDQNINEMKQSLRDTENRISEMINKHIEYTTHLDKERHDEILKINEKIDNSIDSINNKIDSTNKWLIGLIITTILAIGSMALSVWLK